MNPKLDSNSTGCNRRDFVSTLALAGAALPLASVTDAVAAKTPRGAATAKSTNSPTAIHVFSKPLHWMSHRDAATLIAECGYGGIDYTVRVAQGHVLPEKVEEELPRAVDAAHAAGLKVEMITTEITDAREPRTEKVLRTAARVGVKCYRFGNWNYDAKLGIWPTLEKLNPAFKALAALNESVGIHGAIQNHAGTRVGAAVWDLHELLRDLDPRWIGVQYDIRHAVMEGGQSWPLALKLLRPWIRCLDIKDFKWQQSPGKGVADNVPLGEGVVPFDAFFKLVRELNITGPMSVHFEYPPFERAPGPLSDAEKRKQFAAYLRKDLQALKGWIAKYLGA
jgi:L-ribulose-5-phosphate 3-epimerase